MYIFASNFILNLFYSLLQYNIIDTINSSATKARYLLKDIWDDIINSIEVMLTPATTDSDAEEWNTEEVREYAKSALKNVVSIEILSVLKN